MPIRVVYNDHDNLAFLHTVALVPTPHYHEREQVSHTCPICELAGHPHTVTHSDGRCPICGVNFDWIEDTRSYDNDGGKFVRIQVHHNKEDN